MVGGEMKKPEPLQWPFPQWKDGKMVVKKVRMPTKKEQLRELPPALM